MDDLLNKTSQIVYRLQELAECPVCLNTMDSSLRQCLTGHGVCHDCANKLEECPTCEKSFMVNKNVLLMQILDCLPKHCSYADKGCNKLVLDKDHKQYCEFRPFECLQTSCQWKGCVKDLLEHVKECYGDDNLCTISSINVEQQQILNYNQTEHNNYTTIPIIYKSQIFFSDFALCRNVRPGKLAVLHRCHHVPTSKPTFNYYLSISFKKDNFEFTISNKIYPEGKLLEARESWLNNILDLEASNGLIMSESDLIKYQKPNSTNQYEYTVKLFIDDITYTEN